VILLGWKSNNKVLNVMSKEEGMNQSRLSMFNLVFRNTDSLNKQKQKKNCRNEKITSHQSSESLSFSYINKVIKQDKKQ
jgi:hypothetical protein